MKNHAYFANSPRLTGIAKMAMIIAEQPTYPQSIQGLAFPILLLVLSIMEPKKMSVIPSKILETAMIVPTIPGSRPTVFVR